MKNHSTHKPNSKNINSTKAGFWRRLCAAWLDFSAVFVVVWVIAETALAVGIYIPRELAFIMLVITYSLVFTLWIGRTPGKILCGLFVNVEHSGAGGNIRLVLRETIGKLLSLSFYFFGIAAFALWRPLGLRQYIPFGLLIPMILVVFGTITAIVVQRKKLLHDRIGKTIVVRKKGVRMARYGISIAATSLVLLLSSYAYSWYSAIQVSGNMKVQTQKLFKFTKIDI